MQLNHKLKKIRKARMAVIVIVCFFVMEGVLRFGFGLGTPALSIADPEIEYMFAADQETSRFGNLISINHYGMRSADFALEPKPNETRILVFGDSVINGGAPTDQSELATTLLEARMKELLNAPVVVGNVSAGSWGPGNWLAYAKRYGFFEADVVIFVVSAHDASDNPTFLELNPRTHPTVNPWSATSEVVNRYLLPRVIKTDTTRYTGKPKSREEALAQGIADMEALLRMAKANGRRVYVFYHSERQETVDGDPSDKHRLRQLALSEGISFFDMSVRYRESGLDVNVIFRDEIHPSSVGQSLIADALYDTLSNEGR